MYLRTQVRRLTLLCVSLDLLIITKTKIVCTDLTTTLMHIIYYSDKQDLQVAEKSQKHIPFWKLVCKL